MLCTFVLANGVISIVVSIEYDSNMTPIYLFDNGIKIPKSECKFVRREYVK